MSDKADNTDKADKKARIKEFLARFFRNHELADDEDIFALGFVNSLLAMQLVNFVEKEFGITVEDEDLDLDNFRSIDNIYALIERKSGVEAGA
jgi:acyl carrier protein